MFKVFLIAALIGAVWTKGYPSIKYDNEGDDQRLIDEDEVRPQYMQQPIHQTQIEYNDDDDHDLAVEDGPQGKYEQKSVDAFPKRSSSSGGKARPDGKQGTYKGSDLSSEIKHQKKSYEATKITQEEINVKTVGNYGSRLPNEGYKVAPKAYKSGDYSPSKGIYRKKPSEEEYSGHIGQNNNGQQSYGQGLGHQPSYKTKVGNVATQQEHVDVDFKSESTPYKGGKGKGGYVAPHHKSDYESGMRAGHYGSEGGYMGYGDYKMRDAYNDVMLGNRLKSTSYQAPESYGIYREGHKSGYQSPSHGHVGSSIASHQGYGNTAHHNGHHAGGSHYQSGLNSENHHGKHYGGSGYGGASVSKHHNSFGSEYSGVGGARGNGYIGSKSSHGGAYNGYKTSGYHGAKVNSASGYGISAGSNLHSGSGYKGIGGSSGSGYGISSNSNLHRDSGYKSVGSSSGSGYGISAGSNLHRDSGYKSIGGNSGSGYGISAGSNLHRDSGYKSIGGSSGSGYGISAGSNLHRDSGYKSIGGSSGSMYGISAGSNLHRDSGYKSIGGSSGSGYGISAGSNLHRDSGYKSIGGSSGSGYGISAGSNLHRDSGYKSIGSGSGSGYGINAGSNLHRDSGYKSIGGNSGSGYGIIAGSNLHHDSGYKSIGGSSGSGYGISAGSNLHRDSGYKSIGGSRASGYGINAGSHLQSDSGYKSIRSNFGGYGHGSGSLLGHHSYGSAGTSRGIGGQYHQSKGHIKSYGSEYNHGIGGSGSYGHGKAGGAYGSSSLLGGSGYQGAHVGSGGVYSPKYSGYQEKSYNNPSNVYTSSSPLSYHQSTKGNEYHVKSVKSSGVKGYTGSSGHLGGASYSGIKSASAYHGSNTGLLSAGNAPSYPSTGSGTYHPKENYPQSKLAQNKLADDYLSDGGSNQGIESSGYKGIGESSPYHSKGYPTASKPKYPDEYQSKIPVSTIKGGPKQPKYSTDYQGIGEIKSPSSNGHGSDSGYHGAPPSPSKAYAVKGGSGIKGGYGPGEIGHADKKSPNQYLPVTAHSSGGYPGSSYHQPGIGNSDKYDPPKVEQKDLSYEAVLGTHGSSSPGSGSGGYGFTSSGNPGSDSGQYGSTSNGGPGSGSGGYGLSSSGSPSSGYSGDVYGSDDKYEMSKPMPYEFKYEVKDDEHGSDHYREEKMDDDGYLTGRYGYTDANGLYRHVEYQAGKDGFKVNSIKTNEPGTDNQDPADAHFEVEKNLQSQY